MQKEEIIERMQAIVDSCQGEETAACVAGCPMHTNAKEYIRLIGEGRGKEAIEVIRRDIFLPRTMGRICAHPCEGKCKWNEGKSPMAIAALKRYAADNFDDVDDWDLDVDPDNGFTVAVVGSGPAGMQAALELRRQGCKVVVFEQNAKRGGMLKYGIPDYRLPADVLESEISYLDKLDIEFKLGCKIGEDVEFSDLTDNYDAVVVAVGKHVGRVDRSLDHSDANGIYSAADFLHTVKVSGKPKHVGNHVLVIGGGDVAMDCARTALRLEGVARVSSACLEASAEAMFASAHEVKGATDEGVMLNCGEAIQTIHTDENNNVVGVTLQKCVSMFDDEGRFAPKFDSRQTYDLDVDTIVFAIGQGVDADFAQGELEQRRNTTFECDPLTLQSNTLDKVFVAGDASGQSVIAVQAMATGRRAATSVMRYLNNEDMREGRKIEDTSTYDTKLDMPTDWSEIEGKRPSVAERNPEERIHDFEEVYLALTDEQALEEAQRCRQCGCKLCMKECMMLKNYTECPKSLFERYLEEGIDSVNEKIAFSCNECTQCTLECPKDLDNKSIFIGLKEYYANQNGGLTPNKELQACDETQIIESSDEMCIRVDAAPIETKPFDIEIAKSINVVEHKRKTKYVFAPGCSVSAYTPAAMEGIMNHLKDTLGDENVGALLQCCGKVTAFLGEEERFDNRNKKAVDILDDMGAEVIITVCPSCFNVFKDTAKNQKTIAYWDLMHMLIGLPEQARGIGLNSDVVFNVHDSCVTRTETSHHESVRWMLDEMGYKWEEIYRSREYTRCCGVGGGVYASDPKLYEEVYNRRAKDFTQEHIVTYCGSCRGTMQAAGLDAVHILDLMFGPTYMESMAGPRGFKNADEMWANRLESKERFAKFIK